MPAPMAVLPVGGCSAKLATGSGSRPVRQGCPHAARPGTVRLNPLRQTITLRTRSGRRGGPDPIRSSTAAASPAPQQPPAETLLANQYEYEYGLQVQPPRLPGPAQGAVYVTVVGALCLWWSLCAPTAAVGTLFASATLAVQQPAVASAAVLAVKSAWAGMLAGCLHTLAGADHLAALTPLTIGRSRAKSALLGALWGAGHSTGQLLLGLMMVLLKDRFNALMPALTKWGGTMVGLTLLAIGFMGIYEAFFEKHDDDDHNDEIAEIESKAKDGNGFAFATYATGIVYGLQPDALFVVIPALALPTKAAAAAYILMFVIGTCAAMGSYTALIGHTTESIGKSNPWITQNLTLLASVVAIAVGLLVLLPTFGIAVPFSPF